MEIKIGWDGPKRPAPIKNIFRENHGSVSLDARMDYGHADVMWVYLSRDDIVRLVGHGVRPDSTLLADIAPSRIGVNRHVTHSRRRAWIAGSGSWRGRAGLCSGEPNREIAHGAA